MDRIDHELSAIGDRLLFGRLERPRAEETIRIPIVGDPHLATRSEGTDRVFHQTEQRLRTVVDDLNERDVDLVLFPGDITKDGEPWNYDRFDTILAELDHPYVATPGNHDLQKRIDDHECPSTADFARRYADGSLPAHVSLGSIDLFILNSAAGPDGPYTDTHRGLISTDQLDWLEDRLARASTPIVACHHNPLPLVAAPLRHTAAWRVHTMRENERFRSVLSDHDVPLVCSGHHHVPALVERNGLRQCIAPAMASYPQAYCLLEIDREGTTIWLVAHADTAARTEAHRLAAEGTSMPRTLLGITETMLADAPVLSEPSRLGKEILSDR